MCASFSRRTFVTSSAGSVAALPSLARAQGATPAASPAPGGITPERIAAAVDALPSVVQDLLDRTGVPGVAVGAVHNDAVIFAEGFGVREVAADAVVGADTVFQLASLSKPLSSTVVAASLGDSTWDTRISDLDPSFALKDPWITANVTLADLFSHRSGLPDHAGDLLEDLGGTREQVLHRLRYLEPKGAFRASYAYTNFGLTAAAVAIAHAAGSAWEDLAEERLFAPLGMDHTSYRYSDFAAQPNRSVGHVRHDGAWVHLYDRQPDAQSPAGGASSTVRDLCRWMRLQLANGSFDGTPAVDAHALGTTHLPHAISHVPDDPTTQFPGFYGLGWNVGYNAAGDISLSHSGAFAYGAATAVYLRPLDGLGIVVLTNGEPIGLAEAIAVSFLDLCATGAVQNDYLAIFQPIIAASVLPEYGATVASPPASVEPASSPEVYLGTYTNDVFGDLEVTAHGDGLTMRVGPNGDTFPLTHFSHDVFTYQPIGENAGPPSAVTFTVAASGQASRVVVENLDVYGAGTFVRGEPDA